MTVNFRLLLPGFIGLLLWNVCYAQTTNQLKGKYLGQKRPGIKPELFAPGIISTKYYEHSAPAFSPDGKIVYGLLSMKEENLPDC